MSEALNCSLYGRVTSNGFWTGQNPLQFALPLFILQITVVVGTGLIIELLLRPLKQPRIIAEILAGLFLGPSFVGTLLPDFHDTLFPPGSNGIYELLCSIGLVYWLFVVGIQLELAPLLRSVGRKSVVISLVGIFPPFLGAVATYFMIRSSADQTMADGSIIIFLGGIVVSVSSFPILAQIITEHKLVHTTIGMLALSGTVINDIIMWVMIVVAGVVTSDTSNLAAVWVILSGIGFVLVMVYLVRPAIRWVIRQTPEGESVNELYVCLILVGVMMSGTAADALGIRPAFGGLMFGLIIPDGALGTTLIEKVEDLTCGLMLPLFFAITGLRTDLLSISSTQWVLVVVLAVAQLVKLGGTALAGMYYGLHVSDSILLSLLTNTKGVVDIILLNRLVGTKIISTQSFSIMVGLSVVMTMVVSPSVSFLHRRATPIIPYKHRMVQRSKIESELRILACVHSLQTVPTMINLLEASSTTKHQSPLAVFALRLAELTDRASMLIVHDLRAKMDSRHTRPKPQHDNDRIIAAFEDFQEASGIQVQALTSISPYSTMHEDICSVAEEKRIALILLPFHKLPTALTNNEVSMAAIRGVNQNVFSTAPCSVGVLIDRGLSGTTGVSSIHVSHQIAVLFFGGKDDREALCYAARMAEHDGISLTVLRLMIGESQKVAMVPPMATDSQQEEENDQPTTPMIRENKEKERDQEFISDFRLRTSGDDSVAYDEVLVCDGDETVNMIRSVVERKHDLFIVGRNQWLWDSPVVTGLTDWTECPELGPIGDLLASPDFSTVSVLVVQQYSGELLSEDAFTAQIQQFIGSTNKNPVGQQSTLNVANTFARLDITEEHLTKRRESPQC